MHDGRGANSTQPIHVHHQQQLQSLSQLLRDVISLVASLAPVENTVAVTRYAPLAENPA